MDNDGCGFETTNILLNFKAVHLDKKGFELAGELKMEVVENIPRQTNSKDCGMFVCKYAEFLSRRAQLTFTAKDIPYYRARMVWEMVQNKLISP